MLTGLPEPEEIGKLLDEAAQAAYEESIELFDNHVARLRAAADWLPEDVDQVRERLISDEIGLIEAVWLIEPPEERGDYWDFQEDFLERWADALEAVQAAEVSEHASATYRLDQGYRSERRALVL
ncbi:hypothetical protein [uncultured Amaricoccus sp.]|uniref:hypothetical protein n=1 Tax=uncultured Amaricoccus sp. TaxID=339341 RepID=UPI002602A3B7|nr:hypothetical protein [uncultured Amaricoccus sp.]